MSLDLLISAHFRAELRVARLEREAGLEGIGVWIALLAFMRTNDCQFAEGDIDTVASLTRIDPTLLSTVVRICVRADVDLLQISSGKIVSRGLAKRVGKYLASIEAKRAGGRKSAKLRKQLAAQDTSNILPQHTSQDSCQDSSKIPATYLQQHREDKIREDKRRDPDLNKKVTSPTEHPELIDSMEIPGTLDYPEVREALKKFVAYKKSEFGFKFKTLAPLKGLITEANHASVSPAEFTRLVDYAIAKTWKGVGFYPGVLSEIRQSTGGRPVRQGFPQQQEIIRERNIDLVKRLEAEEK